MRTSSIKDALMFDRIFSDKQRKNLSILELVIKRGPISRTDISRLTGLNIVTVSNYINEFIEKELVIEKGFDVSTGGRRPTLVELDPKFGYIIGVGLAAGNIVGILMDSNMQVICEVENERPVDSNEAVIDKLVATVEQLLSKSKIDTEKIKGLGIGIPGIVDEESQSIRWLGALGKSVISISGISLKDIFEKEFNIPTLVEYDAACGAFGERWFGFEADIKDMIYMHSGVGCGLILNGQIYRGSRSSAGELGIFNPPGANEEEVRRESANLGMWELDLGIAYQAKKSLKEGKVSRIFELAGNDPEKIDLAFVIEASKAGDKLANELLETAGRQLGGKASFLVNLLNPEVIVIGGGIERTGPVFIDSVKRTIHSCSREENVRNLRIVPSRLGKNAIAVGAVCLVLQRILMNA